MRDLGLQEGYPTTGLGLIPGGHPPKGPGLQEGAGRLKDTPPTAQILCMGPLIYIF